MVTLFGNKSREEMLYFLVMYCGMRITPSPTYNDGLREEKYLGCGISKSG